MQLACFCLKRAVTYLLIVQRGHDAVRICVRRIMYAHGHCVFALDVALPDAVVACGNAGAPYKNPSAQCRLFFNVAVVVFGVWAIAMTLRDISEQAAIQACSPSSWHREKLQFTLSFCLAHSAS